MVKQYVLRARFAQQLSHLYCREVPAYTTLLKATEEINQRWWSQHSGNVNAEALGSPSRVGAERHGAIRVGSPTELAHVARIFAGFGMHPVGFYDLRDAQPTPIPVVSTAFRPLDAEELSHNPFRVFTSLLATRDPAFFSSDLRSRLDTFLDRRQLFSPRLLELADRAADGDLAHDDAHEFVERATQSFSLSAEPIDGPWYRELEAISPVAADIAGVSTTHINHLTPRVLDIDALYQLLSDQGMAMIPEIQGPPRWNGPDVLLRQTSFRALNEPRLMRESDGNVQSVALRVRFGEVEARGIALTETGRDRYDRALIAADSIRVQEKISTQEALARVWPDFFPLTLREFADRDLAFFTHHKDSQGNIHLVPQVYEDFLPRSAAGIFHSNVEHSNSTPRLAPAVDYSQEWLSGAIGRTIHDPYALYRDKAQSSRVAHGIASGDVSAHLSPLPIDDNQIGART